MSLSPFLLRFLVRLVLAAAITKLLELETARGRLLVLRRRVVALLALSALQRHNFPHFQFPSTPRRSTSPDAASVYLVISETVPAPTVRPPSRIANRKP